VDKRSGPVDKRSSPAGKRSSPAGKRSDPVDRVIERRNAYSHQLHYAFIIQFYLISLDR